MATTGPGISDIKILFARSGNRCAFPKCKAAIVDGDTVLGEAAHIKGARPGSARYDPNQSAEERHACINLILLCRNRHTVIDSDEEAYTVDRLQRMKAAHEASCETISDTDANRVAPLFIGSAVTSVGQQGGVTAGTVILPPGDPVIQTRRLQAIEKMWHILQAMRAEFTDAIFLDQVLKTDEIDQQFKNGRFDAPFTPINNYRNMETVAQKFANAKVEDAVKERPFLSPRVWGIVHVLQALYGRSGFLLTLSFKERKYNDWRNDAVLDQLLRAALPGATVDHAKAKPFAGLHALIEELEHCFMQQAGMSNA
jgi:hypothetical protein